MTLDSYSEMFKTLDIRKRGAIIESQFTLDDFCSRKTIYILALNFASDFSLQLTKCDVMK